MFFYDVNLCAWVRKPGSKSPPEMVPVMGIGGVFDFQISLCNGPDILQPTASDWLCGVKVAGDMSGDYLASDAAPELDGNEIVRFVLDFTTVDANAYFLANPTAETVNAVLQIGYTDAYGTGRRTAPLDVVIQSDYLTS